MSDLKRNLDHSRAAYLFAVESLPSSEDLKKSGRVEKNGIPFTKESQIESMLIEFGWAFFCRYEGCVEAFLKSRKIELTRKFSLQDWFKQNNIQIPDKFTVGIEIYREIRNKLHHEDGAALNGDPNSEIHIYKEQMNNFYEMFVWIGEKVCNKLE